MTARLGVDIGRARVGIACSDVERTLAFPVETVRRRPGADPAELGQRIDELAREHGCDVIYVGLPLNLQGDYTPSTDDAIRCAHAVPAAPRRVVRLIDERFTTNIAAQQLRPSGRKRSRARQVVDQAAAVAILQSALDIEHRLGALAGTAAEEIPDERGI
jgi:putative Holliday junction resolvase